MNGKIVLQLAGLLMLVSAPAFGEAVSLREAIDRALKNNHLLKAAELEQDAAQEEVAATRSRYLPRVQLESGAVLSNTPSRVFMMKLDEGRIDPASDFAADTLNHPSARGDFSTAIRMEQALLDFGIGTGVELARKGAEAAELALEARREQVAYRVYLAYLGVRTARADREVAGQAVVNAREHARLADLRTKDGLGLKSDQLRTATALAEAEQRLLTAQNDLLLARLKLNLAAGGAEGELLDITEVVPLADPLLTEGELVALARVSRPDLKLLEKGVERGELAVRQASDAYFPSLYASGSYQLNDRDLPLGRDNDSWSVGANLRWEIFDGNRRSHGRRKAELARQAARATLENERREVSLQVTRSVLRRQEAALKLETARGAVRAAEEGRRLVALRFENGLSTLVELLDADSALNRARSDLVQVENAYLGAAAEIYFQAGVLVQEVLR